MYKVTEVTSQSKWDNFLNKQPMSNILQSWVWGEFQKAYGRKIWRLGIYKNNKLIGVALAQYVPTKFRTHIYIPNGPVIEHKHFEDGLAKLLGYCKALGVVNGANFIRLDPILQEIKTNKTMLKRLKLVKSKTHGQAPNRWILDISKDEETLLKEMDKSRRYEIRKSSKEGVVVHSSNDIANFDKFITIFEKTVKRQKFIPNPTQYYKTQFEVLCKKDNYRVIWATKDDMVIASALVGYFGNSAYYLHAGSENSKDINKLMGPQAVVWEAIKIAKSKGMKYFDFWGITKSDNPKDSWYGFTKFKKEFGGFQFDTVGTYDLPISTKYTLVSIMESTKDLWSFAYYTILKIVRK